MPCRLLTRTNPPLHRQPNERIDNLRILEIRIINLPELEARVAPSVMLKTPHILRLLSHPRTDRRDRDKDPDLRVVLAHHLTKSAYLRDRGSTRLDLGENPGTQSIRNGVTHLVSKLYTPDKLAFLNKICYHI